MSATASRPVGLAASAAITLGVAMGCGTTGTRPRHRHRHLQGRSSRRIVWPVPARPPGRERRTPAGRGNRNCWPMRRGEMKAHPKPRGPGAAGRPPASQPTGFGEEDHRLVQQKDEIVSVLKNGMAVIAKRVPSPVVSVRGYVQAGGVYEGRGSAGGCSHLLEHLVAGGTNQRRTEEQNRDLLQRIGNNSNAYTTDDVTSFFVNTTADNLEPGGGPGHRLDAGGEDHAGRVPAASTRSCSASWRWTRAIPDRVFYELANDNRYRVSPTRVPVIGYRGGDPEAEARRRLHLLQAGVPAEQHGLRRLRGPRPRACC